VVEAAPAAAPAAAATATAAIAATATSVTLEGCVGEQVSAKPSTIVIATTTIASYHYHRHQRET